MTHNISAPGPDRYFVGVLNAKRAEMTLRSDIACPDDGDLDAKSKQLWIQCTNARIT